MSCDSYVISGLYFSLKLGKLTFPFSLLPFQHIWDVVLVWRKGNVKKTVSATVLCTVIMVHKMYKQFLQVGRLYWALILLTLSFHCPLPPLAHIWDVMLVWREERKLSLSCSIIIMIIIIIVIIIIIEQSWLRWHNVKTARTPYKTKKTKAKGRASSASSKKQCVRRDRSYG